jgi:hypothetical protein
VRSSYTHRFIVFRILASRLSIAYLVSGSIDSLPVIAFCSCLSSPCGEHTTCWSKRPICSHMSASFTAPAHHLQNTSLCRSPPHRRRRHQIRRHKVRSDLRPLFLRSTLLPQEFASLTSKSSRRDVGPTAQQAYESHSAAKML